MCCGTNTSDSERMAAVYSRTEEDFVSDTMSEFIHLWRSGLEASVKIKCKEGKASLNMSCLLGHPEDHHVESRKRRRKSVTKVSRKIARAAHYQAAFERPPSTPRPDTSQAPPAPANPVLTPSRSDICQPSDLESRRTGEGGAVSLSPHYQEEYTECPSSSALSSPRAKRGGGHGVGVELQRFQAVQPCTVGPPHSCEDYLSNCTEAEDQQIDQWIDQSIDQSGYMHPDFDPFLCSLLRELRRS